MKHKLYGKFVACYIILGILGFLVISTLGSRLIENELINAKSQNLYTEALSIANNQADSYYNEHFTLSELYVNLTTLSNYQNSDIWLIGTDGSVLCDTATPLDLTHEEVLDEFNPATNYQNYYTIGTFYDHFDDEVLSVIVPITINMTTRGYIAIHYFMEDIYSLREAVLAKVYIIYLIIFGLFLFILGLFSFSVYWPLQKIIKGSTEYAAGNLTYYIPVRADDEMGYLASTLNYMSNELAKTGESQRNFIANVSHDFRSPLTSIKGYAEAMLDGTIPVEMQDKYLKIITFETERLNKLTKGLLTLNDMDDKGRMLDISTFDINAIIKSTATTFEGICTTKRISIQVIFFDNYLNVTADMGKIQQVLYNLIDNAIKFSNNDSIIYVETTVKHGKVFISVKDTGAGIPKESLSKVWDRFYKLDVSRGKDRKGTGLGLSIVKEIISAHNQNIDVISTEGVGTEFIFTLDLAKS